VPERPSNPSIGDLRAVTQPASIFARNSGEHWAGRLYVRRASPYLTRQLLRTPITPDGVTWLMILAGLLAAAALTLPGLAGPIAAVVLIQLQILLDCSDGELARWLERRSPVGVYLDRIGHWLTEAALPIGLGIHADGGWDSIGTYTTLGLVIAVLVLLVKGESALAIVARAESGLPPAPDTRAVAAPRGGLLRSLRRTLGYLPFYRAFVAMEATLLALLGGLVDVAAGDHVGTQTLVVVLVPVAAVTALGHLVAILASGRLR
jgi:phosphatidylglycerophosphate synthase